MRLYKIEVEHYSQKDSHHSIEAFVIAPDEEAAIKWLMEHQTTRWDDTDWQAKDGEIDPTNEWWDAHPEEAERAKVMGLEVEYCDWGDRKGEPEAVAGLNKTLLRWWRGDFGEVSDLYYGATQYSWDEGVAVGPLAAALLAQLGVAIQT